MRLYALSATLLLLAALSLPAGGESQLSMTEKACEDRDAAETRMTKAYRVLLERSKDRALKAAVEKAQHCWLVFRDAELAARYPVGSSRGSASAMCRCLAAAAMNRERAEKLEKWDSGEPAGDVCAGPR